MITSLLAGLIHDYTLLTILGGTCVMGFVAGAMGVFAMLRKQSLLGDAVAHAALPGIGCMFLATHTTNPFILLLGGAISGWLGTVAMNLIVHMTTLKKDTALGIVLSVFFGFGLLVLTIIQKLPTANQSILNKFLFGNASTLLLTDVHTMELVGTIVILILIVLFKEATVSTFDPLFAQTIGIEVTTIDMVLTTLMVVAIVIGLQTVGVVLMSSLLIAPAAAARQWTNQLRTMTVLAALFGAAAGMLGTLASSQIDHLPTGPAIVVTASLWVMVSLLFGTR